MAHYEIPAGDERRRVWPVIVLVIAAVAVVALVTVSKTIIQYEWWKEMGQVSTWIDLLTYQIAPVAVAALLGFVVLFIAHQRAMRFSGFRLRLYPTYAKLATGAALLLGIFVASSTIDSWTVMRYLGGRGIAANTAEWRDPVFGNALKFYLFDLPFYSLLRGYLFALAIVTILVYWATARAWQIKDRFADLRDMGEIDLRVLRLKGGLESRFLRIAAAAVLLALAYRFFLGRYEMLWNDHGFMTGVDYVDQNIALPLQWALIGATLLTAALVAFGRWKWLLLFVGALVIRPLVPAIVGAVYVKPNEITIERPFIQRHIRASRAAFGFDGKLKETSFNAKLESQFDPAQNQAVLSNVRLWDWQAFHDTITQQQAIRTYYTFADTDIDRYTIDGQLRQVLLSPRELDINALPAEAGTRWPNRHFVYTHGYGLVMAEANRITADGLPVLFIQDAPPVVNTKSLKLTRPELYYSEVTHDPVFVHTAQPEFNYPSGSDNVFSRYEGKGGFPISSFGMRLVAAVAEGDPNILLTQQLTPQSRMMILRDIRERVEKLAGFLTWETDPYLVLTDSGRLVWTIDGYTTSGAHPYARRIDVAGIGPVNYMRNAVKATVDAYDGETRFYIFDPSDPIIQAYERLFPRLFQPESAMPADLRAHVRYPELLFRVQAEAYRTFHMQDPQAFYNREDLWDIAKTVRGQGQTAAPMAPTYVVASLPGENRAEFLLIIPFTPRNKDNLIGLMVARCDGQNLGELRVLQLSKQALIYGPMQIEARINQDQNISKDLTLWNQQGSQVLRGQMLVLPIDDTFLYIEPLYIQSSEARMPQLKKIALVMGNRLIYTDTWDEAVAQLTAMMQGMPLQPAAAGATPEAVAAPAAPAPSRDLQQRLDSIRMHIQRYRELAGQGKWSEAGKELEAIENETRK
jgi:uncharacterized membrane protein (UPF0182 family)